MNCLKRPLYPRTLQQSGSFVNILTQCLSWWNLHAYISTARSLGSSVSALCCHLSSPFCSILDIIFHYWISQVRANGRSHILLDVLPGLEILFKKRMCLCMKWVSKDLNVLRSFSISHHIELRSRDLPEAYSLTLGSAAEGTKKQKKNRWDVWKHWFI